MGAVGTSNSAVTSTVNNLIKRYESGSVNVPYEDVQDIRTTTYGLATDKLSKSERDKLAQIVYDSVVSSGATALNSMNTVQNINDGKTAQLNISQFSSDDLKDIIRMSSKVSTVAGNFLIEDALKLLAYYKG